MSVRRHHFLPFGKRGRKYISLFFGAFNRGLFATVLATQQ